MPRHLLALASSITLFAGVGIALAPAALADDPPAPDTSQSHASARYLNVSGGPSTAGAEADYAGGGSDTSGPTVTDDNDVAGVGPFGIPGIAFINGAVGSEHAEAGPGGKSWAASARISANGQPQDAASVDLDLGKILGYLGVRGVTDSIHLKLQEVAGIAALDAANPNALATSCADWSAPDQCRGYTLKSGSLEIESVALKALMAQIQTLAGQIDTAIGTYTTALPTSVTDSLLAPINTYLGAHVAGTSVASSLVSQTVVKSASVSAGSFTASVSGTVASTLVGIVSASHTVGGVTLDLGNGKIDVDYDAVLGGLNNLPPNSPLFGSAVVASIKASLSQIITDITAAVKAAVEPLLKSITLQVTGTMSGSLVVSTQLGATYGGKFHPVGTAFDASADMDLNVAYAGTLWDVLHGAGTVSAGASIPLPGGLSPLTIGPVDIDLDTLLPGGLLGSAVDPVIDAAINDLADGIKSLGNSAIDTIAGALNSASSVFGGGINVQAEDTPGAYRETALELWFKTGSPLRGSGGAFQAVAGPAVYVGPPAGATVIRLGTAIVGPNAASGVCPAGTTYDKASGACLKPTIPTVPAGGGGTPTTTTTPPTTTTTAPSTEVLGSSDTTTSPSVTVKGESSEAPQTTQVLGLAETGPHDVALIAVLGLELLLGGIAIIRLTARRRRELTDQHHV